MSYFTLGVRALAKYHRAAQVDKIIPADLLRIVMERRCRLNADEVHNARTIFRDLRKPDIGENGESIVLAYTRITTEHVTNFQSTFAQGHAWISIRDKTVLLQINDNLISEYPITAYFPELDKVLWPT